MARIVVVGAGSSGAPLAARLAESGVEVVLVDAGPDWRPGEVDDAFASPNPGRGLRASPDFTWPGLVARRTATQEPYLYWRGRGLGGTSTVNGQIAIRPGPEEFDRWPAGWSWADVLPAFVRLEDDEQFGDEPYHGRGGPIPIHRAPLDRWEPVDLALRDAALAAGHAECADHNAPTGTGVSPFAINSRQGRRVSTNEAYLEPARASGRLRIVGRALVDRLVIRDDGKGPRASGVWVRVDDGPLEVIEGDVVVLAAGAVHSPAILQRSGIGPADAVLRPLGIEVVADLPVGGVMEHPIAYCVLRLRPSGRASSVDARHTNCTVRATSGVAHGRRHDLMFIGNNLVGGDDAALAAGIVGIALEESRSRGEVRISSTDPSVDPTIELAMLSDPADLERMRSGARHLFELARSAPVQAIANNVTAGRATAIDDLVEDAALDRWLLAEAVDGNHAASSCPMGSVLDADCRVHGVGGLHVVDASAFPVIPAANPHLTAVMLGEVMAERLAAQLGAGQPARSASNDGNSTASSRAR